MTNKTSLLVTSLVAAASLQLASAADVTGKITLKGTPPDSTAANEKYKDNFSSDALCRSTRKDFPQSRVYVVGAKGELADTLVYIKSGLPAGKTYDAPAKAAVLDQKGCEYVPYIVALQTKQKLEIKNSDPALHNINASGLKNNPAFNEAQGPKAPDKIKTFEKPEMFASFACNVHAWMTAYVSVFEHPYFAQSGKDGTFKISNLPPGDYVIEAWHRKAGKAEKKITVGKDNQVADFELELKPTL